MIGSSEFLSSLLLTRMFYKDKRDECRKECDRYLRRFNPALRDRDRDMKYRSQEVSFKTMLKELRINDRTASRYYNRIDSCSLTSLQSLYACGAQGETFPNGAMT
jgi:hypothetical protein